MIKKMGGISRMDEKLVDALHQFGSDTWPVINANVRAGIETFALWCYKNVLGAPCLML